jgi:hypothetical protein
MRARAYFIYIDFWMVLQFLLQSIVRSGECIVVMKATHRDVLGSPRSYTGDREQSLAEFIVRHGAFPLERSVGN